ncbi:MAG: putative bifunctional diguanylate cyclase/phosphodiesterase [Spirochaetia bacterium]
MKPRTRTFFQKRDIPVHRFTLAFPGKIEKDFQESHKSATLPQSRSALLLAFFFYGLFGILDYLLFPGSHVLLWINRFGGVLPAIAITFGLTYTRLFNRFYQQFLTALVFFAGGGLFAMFIVAGRVTHELYYVGFILILFFSYTFIGLRFIWATVSGALLIILYAAFNLLFFDIPEVVFINNVFMLLTADVLGMFAAYYIEYSKRKNFYLNSLLKLEREEIERLATRLEDRVASRTAELSEANKQLAQSAYVDPLTGLLNRKAYMENFEKLLKQARRGKEIMRAVLYVDLDFFQEINDQFGNIYGDQVLVETSRLLTHCVRDSDYVYRIGSDEFIVVLSNIILETDAALVAEKIFQRFSRDIRIKEREISVSMSIGIAIFPKDGKDANEITSRADIALMEAKKTRNAYVFYSQEIQSKAVARVELISELRKAYSKKEFVLFFQPIYNDAERIVGAEALLRWKKGGGAFIGPADFISVLEDSGLINKVGQWILEQACTHARDWNSLLNGQGGAFVSVNFSVKQFREKNIHKDVKRILEKTGLPPSLLHIEITESLFLEDAEAVTEKIQFLRDLGVVFSIDDFGTGYSSLQYLKSLPVDRIKIDRIFISGVPLRRDDTSIVNSIVAMANGLNLGIIAEGIENSEQFFYLKTLSELWYQGFHFSRPVPVEEFKEILVASRAEKTE